MTAARHVACLAALLAAAAPATAQVPAPDKPLRGVNLAGAEFNAARLPGRPNVDYVFPAPAQLDWAAANGFRIIRLPLLWERLQPALDQDLDGAELGRLRATVDAATRRNLAVAIDIHNYGAFRGQRIGSPAVPAPAFADLWRRLARQFRNDPAVVFGLMNEPQIAAAEDWRTFAQLAIDAIRAEGARNLVLVPGAGWDGAHSFATPGKPGPSNATVLEGLRDPANATAFEVHQYLDADFSGTHGDCPAADRAEALLQPFTDWLRAGRRRGFLGEFGVPDRPECLEGLRRMLTFMDANADVWLGWTYWAAGAWWGPNYPFSVEPRRGEERPQMRVLRPAELPGPR